jgi:hypothetical protein
MSSEAVRWGSKLEDLPPELLRGLGCIRPIRLLPMEVDGSREVRSEVILTRCGSRFAANCPSCSALYVGDAAKLLRLGTFGAECARFIWWTLTLPSYGATHYVPNEEFRTEAQRSRGLDPQTRYRRCPCGVFHDPDDPLKGVPLNPKTYDYDGAVIGNYMAGKLLSHTLRRVSRHILGDGEGSIPNARVMEWQQRLSVHFHGLFRIDGDTTPDLAELREVIAESEVSYVTADANGVRQIVPVTWGAQLELTVIDLTTDAGRVHAAQTLGYIPKLLAYSTKSLMETAPDTAEGVVRLRHISRMREAARRLLVRHRTPEARASRQVATFGWNGQAFRTSASWAPGMGMQALRQVRVDFVKTQKKEAAAKRAARAIEDGREPEAFEPFDGREVTFSPVYLAPGKTVGDVLDQRTYGYSDRDFTELRRPHYVGLMDTHAAFVNGVEDVKERRAARAESRYAAAEKAVLKAWNDVPDDLAEYD